MARIKGALGKKNMPSNKEFKDEVKSLSMELIRKLKTLVRNPDVADSSLLRAANLIIPLHADIVGDEEELSGNVVPTEGEDKQKEKPKLFSLTAIK